MRNRICDFLAWIILSSASFDDHAALGRELPTHLLVMHTSHEGSHFFSDSMRKYACVQFEVDEALRDSPDAMTLHDFFNAPYDELATRVNHSQGGWHRPSLPEGASFSMLKAFGDEGIISELPQPLGLGCQCTVRATLVRAVPLVVRQWCHRGLFRKPHQILPIFCVRTDLMRWAISAYGKLVDGMEDNPQFRKQGGGNTMVTYDLKVVRKCVEILLRRWTTIARKIAILQKCGTNPIISTYEALEDVEGEIPKPLMDKILPCDPVRRYENDPRISPHVHKAHSNRLANFSANSKEIFVHFAATPYPTFAQVLKTTRDVKLDKLEFL